MYSDDSRPPHRTEETTERERARQPVSVFSKVTSQTTHRAYLKSLFYEERQQDEFLLITFSYTRSIINHRHKHFSSLC